MNQVLGAEEKFSIIVPTRDVSRHLEPLYRSVLSSGLAPRVTEVIFVLDGCVDSTAEVLRDLSERVKKEVGSPPVKMIEFPENLGRFMARYQGAEAASAQKVLFMDSRVILPIKFSEIFFEAASIYPALTGHLDIDTSRDVFSLYWDRSHRVLFRRHFKDTKGFLTLTPENFDRYLKGTTFLFCSRDVFVQSCRKFEGLPLYSDDTFLMKEMVAFEPITIHPRIRFHWVPRDNWKRFLKALWDRGPGFAEYHVFEKRGILFAALMLGLMGIFLEFVLLFVSPALALQIAAFAIALVLLSAWAFARSLMEWIRIAPLHLGVIVAYGFGALRGVWVIYRRKKLGPGVEKAAKT